MEHFSFLEVLFSQFNELHKEVCVPLFSSLLSSVNSLSHLWPYSGNGSVLCKMVKRVSCSKAKVCCQEQPGASGAQPLKHHILIVTNMKHVNINNC